MSDFEAVKAWHEAMGLPSDEAQFEDEEFKQRRARYLAEEFAETMSALGFHVSVSFSLQTYGSATSLWKLPKPSKEEFADGICDSVWVNWGSLVELGWNGDGAFSEVVRSNWTKLGAPRDAAGKLMKGPHFIAPDLSKYVK